MLDAWLNRSRAAAPAEKLLPLPEQEFASWALGNAARRHGSGLVVTLVGDAGSGKSSLVRQALRQLGKTPPKKIVCLAAPQWPAFAEELAALEEPIDPRHKPELIILEDLPSLPDPRGEGDKLAAWIDQWRPAGVSLVITSDMLPIEIPELSPRLRNRLHGGLFAGIRPLSIESMQTLWRQWAGEMPLPAWRPDNIPAGLTTAGQLKIWAASCPDSSSATSPPELRSLSLEDIAQAVADEFGVPVEALESGSRATQLRVPRSVAMSLARELTPLSQSTISRYFGCRSHSTVARSGPRLEQLLAETPALRQQLQSLRTCLRQEPSAECG